MTLSWTCTGCESGNRDDGGLINEELLFDWIWVGGPWERIKGFALGQRKEFDNPKIYELFEALAEAETRADAKVPVGATQR